jgi:WD40 repeat protein/serine/threonine protein kinase
MPKATNRNLLFGILALQMDFISRDALDAAVHAWVLDKSKPLDQILLEHKALSADTRSVLDALVEKHLEMHGNDPDKCLAALQVTTDLARDLEQITAVNGDADRAAPPQDPYATRAPDESLFTPPDAAACPDSSARFRKLRPHARGGLGAVFVAHDTELNREVALKEIQERHADDDASRARFLQEAEITGGLEHPGIVPVYGLGQYADGRPYYAMRFIRGDSLKEAIDRFHQDPDADFVAGDSSVTFRQLLSRFLDTCNAMAYAHSRGVIHRDLKPANIMLGKYGETLVVDWGLAKAVGQPEIKSRSRPHVKAADEPPLRPSGSSGHAETLPGSTVGTPQYMSPEQAAGQVDLLCPASDVYSLGATLYTLLTGQPPVLGTDVPEILNKVERGAIVPPRQIKKDIPQALEAICLKAMALKPEDRYKTAEALADDVEHWLADEPVSAVPEGLSRRLARWHRRHRAAVQAGVAALLVITVGSIFASFWLNSAYRAADAERVAVSRANDTANQRLIRLWVDNGMDQVEGGDVLGSLPWLVRALQMAEGKPEAEHMHRIRLATVLELCPRLSQLWFHSRRVTWADYSPDGRRVLTTCADGVARIWRPDDGSAILELNHGSVLRHASFSPSGDRVVTAGTDGIARIWDSVSGKELTPPLRHDSRIFRACFSPDGRRVLTASADGTARLWDAATGKAVLQPLRHKAAVRSAYFSPDGRLVVTASDDHTAQVWDAETAQPVGPPLKHADAVSCAVFNRDSSRVATASADSTARIWDATTGEPRVPPLQHNGPVLVVTFSPRDRVLLSGGMDNCGYLWDGTTGRRIGASLQHYGTVFDATFSADGDYVATASNDNTARVWDTHTGAPVSPPLRHNSDVNRAVICPDPEVKQLLSASADGTARLWIPSPRGVLNEKLQQLGPISQARFSPDGQLVLTATTAGEAYLWEANFGHELKPIMKHDGAIYEARFGPDGRRIATGSADHTARLWDTATRLPLGPPLKHGGEVRTVDFSPDGQLLATGCSDRTATLWDTATGKQVGRFTDEDAAVMQVHFSPGGRRLAIVCASNHVHIWNVEEPEKPPIKLRHLEEIFSAHFSPDGRHIVTASADRTAQVWDPATGKPVGVPMFHGGKVFEARFDRAGRRIITASDDSTARVWDAATGKLLLPPFLHRSSVFTALFGPKDERVVTAGADHTARVWDATTGEPLTPPLRHGAPVISASFNQDATRLVTAGAGKLSRVWNLPVEKRPLSELIVLAKLMAGAWIDDTGGVVPLSPEELHQIWKKAVNAGLVP